MQEKRWPFHSEDEINAVKEVLHSGRTNYWTGEECIQFEKEYADFVGTQYAVALMNGTVALEAALYAIDIKPGDEVITTCRTFIASASSIVMRGAKPIIADIDINSQNINAETIEPCITSRTKAIIVVHLAGWPADMKSILALAKKYDLKVIEDCAQAHGAAINNKQVGSWGDIAAFSFCQDKIITTGGEGGMITTNDNKLWEKIWSFKDHGKNYHKVYHQTHPPGFRWLHDSFGTNWRMTEMQAAIGRVQLKKLALWHNIRNQNAEVLSINFEKIDSLRVPKIPNNIRHAYYKYYVFLRLEMLKPGWDRNKILSKINSLGIKCYEGSCSDIQQELAFKNTLINFHSDKPNAKLLEKSSLMFLVDPSLTKNDMQKTADGLIKILREASNV